MRYTLTVPLLFIIILNYSQNKLVVNYEVLNSFDEKAINFGDQKLSDNLKKQISDKIKQENTDEKPKQYQLNYYNGNSYFFNLEIKENPNIFKKQKIETFKLKNKSGYYNLNDYDVEKFYGYNPDTSDIEYTVETQEIEKYPCKLAIVNQNGIKVKVWYTENIPYPTGPFSYLGYPGLVLKIEKPKQIIYATKITNDCKPEDIKKMDEKLPIYEGTELELKKEEANKKLKEYRKTEIGKQGDLFKNRF